MADEIGDIYRELEALGLRASGMVRKGDSIHLLYADCDSRVDSQYLDPFFDRIHKRFQISYCGGHLGDLGDYGFTPEIVRREVWENWVDIKSDSEIITIGPKKD